VSRVFPMYGAKEKVGKTNEPGITGLVVYF
jgi:hypothetical protein